MSAESILRVEGLRTEFHTESGLVKAVNDISFELARGETLGLVGESGCGKSVTNLSILRLVQSPPGKIAGGKVLFEALDGSRRDLLAVSEEEVRVLRGKNISMIFQDPLTSLNPVLRVGVQIAEAIQLHHGLRKREARAKSIEMMRLIGMPDPERRVDDYPHQFSGGMRQRVMIAMALSCKPDILIADEPTTALDVTIQAQILDLIKSLSARDATAVIMITHDLGVVAGMCDSICVMYAGRIVEKATVDDLFHDPLHPYTKGLLASIPRVDAAASAEGSQRLYSIPGAPPSLVGMSDCCPFHPRCESAMGICRSRLPPETVHAGKGPRSVSCWLHAKEGR